MSRAGAPSARLRNVRGVAICPLVVDLEARGEPALWGSQPAPCAVCGRPASTAPSTRAMLARGYVVICSYDAWRFKHLLTHRIHAPGEDVEIRRSVEDFARIHGCEPGEVERVLPPELAWLTERGIA